MPSSDDPPVVVVSPMSSRWTAASLAAGLPPTPEPAGPLLSNSERALAKVVRASGGVLERLNLLRFKVALRAFVVVLGALGLRAILEEGFGFTGLIVDSTVSSFTWPCMLAIGVILQGVIEDYKSAERLPADIATMFDSLAERIFFLMALDARAPVAARGAIDARALHGELLELLVCVFEFFAGVRNCSEVLTLSTATGLFLTDAAARVAGGEGLSWEIWQSFELLRAALLRQSVIRRTEFLPAGSLLIKGVTYVIIILYVLGIYALDIVDVDNRTYYGTAYLTIAVNTALFAFVLFLAEDLDDPFEYSLAALTPLTFEAAAASLTSKSVHSDEVDVFPLLEVYARLAAYSGDAASAPAAGSTPPVSALAALLAAAPPDAAPAPSVLGSTDVGAPERRAFRRRLAAAMRSALSGSAGNAAGVSAWDGARKRRVSTLRRCTDGVLDTARVCCARRG